MFHTYYDYFKYIIMSFDLINAFIIFQAYINKTLISLLNVTSVPGLNRVF